MAERLSISREEQKRRVLWSLALLGGAYAVVAILIAYGLLFEGRHSPTWDAVLPVLAYLPTYAMPFSLAGVPRAFGHKWSHSLPIGLGVHVLIAYVFYLLLPTLGHPRSFGEVALAWPTYAPFMLLTGCPC